MTKPRATRHKPHAAADAARPPDMSASPAVPRSTAGGTHRLIRASAGTGKTFQLSGRYIDRLRTSEPEQILATTFTRAAAGEILERVLLRLAEAALRPERLADLSRQVALPTGEKLAAADCLAWLASLTQQLHRVRVGTLDSFFIQLAQSFALELGLPPGWRILDSIEEQQIQSRAIERLLHNHPAGEVGPLLNLLSRGDAGRSVVKELRLAARQFYDVYQATSREAWIKLPEPLPLPAEELRDAVMELDRAAEFLPDRDTWRDAHNKSHQLACDGEWEKFLTGGIAPFVADGSLRYRKGEVPVPVAAAYARLIPHARAVILRQLAVRNRVTWELLDRLHAEMQALKHEQQGLTFADVTRALGQGWRHHALSRLDYRMDASIEHLLLDEFQDTSIPQWHALEPLARRVTAAEHTSLFCVGDQKQAIYGWRGGVAELFDAVQERLPGVESEPLSRSFRSSPAVIEAVNRVAANLDRHPHLEDQRVAVERWQQRFDAHATAKSDLPGCVTLEAAPDAEEAAAFDYAARRIVETHRRTPQLSIGVLAKTNDAVAALARLVRSQGVEVSEEGTSRLNDNVAVQVLCSLVRIADHPGDTAARYHVATSPLASALNLPESDAIAAWEPFAVGLRRELLETGYGRCIDRWARAIAAACDPRGVSRLRQLVDLAHDYDAHATLRPLDFVEFIEAHPALQPAAARVRVMTIHRSKGLEFDVVFLPELNQRTLMQHPEFVTGAPAPVDPPDTVLRYTSKFVQSLLPAELQQVFRENEDRKIEEALCVLYVALTRARHALHLIVFPSSGSEKTKNMATLLRAGLTDGGALAPGATVVVTGDVEWWRQLPREEADPPPSASPIPLAIPLAPSLSESAPGHTLRPSRHSHGSVRLQELLAPANAVAMSRGTLIHAWCEQIDWLDNRTPADAELRRIARRLGLESHDLDETPAEFRRMIAAPAVTAVLSRAAYLGPQCQIPAILAGSGPGERRLHLRREQRFQTPVGDAVVNGCIDRLVLIEHGGQIVAADIVDFKTDVFDHVSREAARERRAGYHRQLRLYQQAVGHLYDLPPRCVFARLIYLATGVVEAVPSQE